MTSSVRLQQEADQARAGLSSALDDLKNSVTTEALTNGAMTFAKDGSTAVAKAAVDRAMANPLAAMLIGAGIFMLMSQRSDGTSPVGDLVEKGKSALHSAAESVRETASSATEQASASAGGFAESAIGLADGASNEAKGMLERGKEQAHDLTAKGREQAHKVLDQSRGQWEKFAREQPILVAALGVALGAAVGTSLPLTKAEQDYLGDAARKARAKGGDIARDVADAVTDKLAGDNAAKKVGEVIDAVSSTVAKGLRS